MSKKIITALFAAALLALGITACQPKDTEKTTSTTETESDVNATTDHNGDTGTTHPDTAAPVENTDSTTTQQ